MEKQTDKGLRHHLRQSRAFLFTLIVIALLWLMSNMSELRSYREYYAVRFTGFDTVRLATTYVDSVIAIDVTSNGFRALHRSLSPKRTLRFSVPSNLSVSDSHSVAVSVNTNEIVDLIAGQLDMRGVTSITPVQPTLSLRLALRQRKAFVPDISKVSFRFQDMYGLSGQPVVSPDTVWLYGSQASLDKIDSLYAAPQTIEPVSRSDSYQVQLEPVWRKYPDLRVSTPQVSVYLPVDIFVEKTVSVPLSFTSPMDVKRIHLYPTQVNVQFSVPISEYTTYGPDDFSVSVNINNDSGAFLHPVVNRFPSLVRVQSVSPSEVQYIVIK